MLKRYGDNAEVESDNGPTSSRRMVTNPGVAVWLWVIDAFGQLANMKPPGAH